MADSEKAEDKKLLDQIRNGLNDNAPEKALKRARRSGSGMLLPSE